MVPGHPLRPLGAYLNGILRNSRKKERLRPHPHSTENETGHARRRSLRKKTPPVTAHPPRIP